jgi:hypothetical protein
MSEQLHLIKDRKLGTQDFSKIKMEISCQKVWKSLLQHAYLFAVRTTTEVLLSNK